MRASSFFSVIISVSDCLTGVGHSHSGGETSYVRLFRPTFLASPSPKDPIYFYNLTQRPHIFSQNCVLSRKAPIFSEKLKF